MEKLKVKCKDHEGELISIKPDTITRYPDGSREIKTYRVKLDDLCGDIITSYGVYADDIQVFTEE
ncbi:MAG: hypothetical protein LUE92_04640 [Clostridiales bacterium]|nr:hypothetical protein [Clostridiales bacterium]